jgi:sulfur carrier protein ThiS adenylyltransferase
MAIDFNVNTRGSQQIRITVNETAISVPRGMSLYQIRQRHKADADLIIYNGHPVASDHPVEENDRIVLIRRGEIPSPEEMESLMMARHTPGIHQKVKSSVVGIAGAGGLGSSIAIALARTGVGHLIIVDFDLIEPSNLNRQQYFVDQIGIPKVEALQKNLLKINPYVRVDAHHEKLTPGDVERIFGAADVIVEAFDKAEEKAMLINVVSEKMKDKYVVAASGVAGYGDANEIQTVRVASKIFIVGDQKTAARPGMGLMAPRVGVAAHHQANIVLRILLGEEK